MLIICLAFNNGLRMYVFALSLLSYFMIPDSQIYISNGEQRRTADGITAQDTASLDSHNRDNGDHDLYRQAT